MSEILFNVDSTTNSVQALERTLETAFMVAGEALGGYVYHVVIRIEREPDSAENIGRRARNADALFQELKGEIDGHSQT